MTDTYTRAQMRTYLDVSFFPIFQYDLQREAAERAVRPRGGTKPDRDHLGEQAVGAGRARGVASSRRAAE